MCKYTNLIHAKDLAKIIIGCLTNTKTSRLIINVSDGTPIKTTDYYLKIYDALDLSYPEFITMTRQVFYMMKKDYLLLKSQES